jgi:hypothetical protein
MMIVVTRKHGAPFTVNYEAPVRKSELENKGDWWSKEECEQNKLGPLQEEK